MKKDPIVFALSSSKKLAATVAKTLGFELGKNEIERFSDGEIIVRCLSEVKDKEVYIIQSTSYPVSDKIFEILVFVDALKNKGAKDINLVIPYYGYSRQDRVAKEGEPVSAKMVASLYETVGIKKIITVDLHTPGITSFFTIPVINLEPAELYANFFKKKFFELGIDLKDIAVVTPDHGSINRAEQVNKYLKGSSVIYVEKIRPRPNESRVLSIKGDVFGKICLLVDDIIDTGGTINNVAEELINKGARSVFVVGTHAIFSKGPLSDRISYVAVTDTLEKEIDGVEVISIAGLISNAIKNA